MGKDPVKSKEAKAFIFAIAAVLCWSTIGSATKLSLGHVSYIQLLLYASFTAIIVLLIMVLLTNKIHIIKDIRKKDLLRSATYGFLNPFAYYMVLFKAYDLLTAQEAVVLNYTWPIALVLLSIPILGQRIGLKSIGALIISFMGIVVIVTGGSLKSFSVSDPTGAALALGSSIIWGIYWILNLRDKREELTKLLVNFSFGFVYVLIAAIIADEIHILSLNGLLGVIYIGTIEMALAFAFWLNALKLAPTTAKVSNLIYISPFMSLILVSILVGEQIMLSSWAGLILIVAGIILQQTIKSSKR
jgi:drug/metabolite transporter (DMT)-like permease